MFEHSEAEGQMVLVDEGWSEGKTFQNQKVSVYERAYGQMLEDIRSGYLRPGEKLKIRALVEQYGISTGACREVLIRLTCERFVESHAMSGFRVRPLSAHEFSTAVEMRDELEVGALEDSLSTGDAAWEEGLVVAFHRLARASSNSQKGKDDRETAHRAFHSALVAGSLSMWKRSTVQLLCLHIERYRRIVNPSRLLSKHYIKEVDEEHEQLMRLALARDIKNTVELLRNHRARSLEDIVSHLK